MKAFAADDVGLGLESASVRELPDPKPNPRQVRVRVAAASLNSADLKVLEWRDGASFIHGRARPHVVGYDFSGVIDEVGADVAGLHVGDAVFGFLPYARSTKTGSLAEWVLAKPEWLAKKPESVSHEDAATLGTAAVTALQGLRDELHVRSGQRLLVHGASGGVGTFAVQIAKKLGLSVVATASASKLAAVRGLGADEVFDYRATAVPALPGPFDGFFDAAVKSSYGECRALLSSGAGYLTLLPSLSLVTGKLRSMLSSHHVAMLAVAAVRADLEQLAAWVVEGAVRPQIGARFGLEQAGEGIAAFRSGKVFGKIVVTI
jgi:NADPH:quinone reductase-like Zn-dependent oxidoreductase